MSNDKPYFTHPCKRHVFIGYDEREDAAFEVAKYSILSQIPENRPQVMVHKLDHRMLRREGLFKRKWLVGANGLYKDIKDEKPFSTQFSHTRFLVPALCRKMRIFSGQALFVDCDFVFRGDINDLFDLTEKNDAMISCVKHDFVPTVQEKMDGCIQTKYTFKLWSALMMFNLDIPKLYELLTPEVINSCDGGWLHRFLWINRSPVLVDSEIGDIPETWHFVPDHSEERVDFKDVRAIHYTLGGPWFDHMKDCKYARTWWQEYRLYIENKLFPEVERMEKETT